VRTTPELDRLLRERFVAACKKETNGNADAFGRLLGYTNGGYVREIVRGVKPVREAIIERVQALPGYAGWFADLMPPLVARDVASKSGGPSRWPFERLSYDAWHLLSERERGAIEEAALVKLKEIRAEKAQRALWEGGGEEPGGSGKRHGVA
jgi:hypothetical protein